MLEAKEGQQLVGVYNREKWKAVMSTNVHFHSEVKFEQDFDKTLGFNESFFLF